MDSTSYTIPTPRRRLSLFVSDTFGEDLNVAFKENKPKSPSQVSSGNSSNMRAGTMREDTPPPPPPSPVSWSKRTDYFAQPMHAYGH